MIFINLLPHRENKKTQQQQVFLAGLLLIFLIAAVIYYGVYEVFVARAESEQQKILYLQGVTQQLDQKIASIADLRKKRDALLAREKIIGTLQDRRDLSVRIFNSLATITPPGVFLTKLQQQGETITLSGYAEGNDQVAAFMRHIEHSGVFNKPTLDIISKAKLGGDEVNQFTLQMQTHLPTEKPEQTHDLG